MLKPNERIIRNLSASETEAVKSNLHWSYLSRVFSSSFIKQIKKGNINARAAGAFVQIAKETTPKQPTLPNHINSYTVGLCVHELFIQTNAVKERCYLTELYKALAPYIRLGGNNRVMADSFDVALKDIDTIQKAVAPYFSQVRQNKSSNTAMHELLLESRDRMILVAYIFAFKSIILTEGYHYQLIDDGGAGDENYALTAGSMDDAADEEDTIDEVDTAENNVTLTVAPTNEELKE